MLLSIPAKGILDEVDGAVGAVADADRALRAAMSAIRGRFSSSGTSSANPLRGEVRVLDDERAAGGDLGLRVAPLFAVSDGQRHVHRRQPQAHHSLTVAAPARDDHEVRRRQGQLHPVAVAHHRVTGKFRGRQV